VGEARHVVGDHGTADAGMFRPAMHAGFEERSIDDQLTAAFEQIEQARFAARTLEHISLLHSHPGHSPALGCERVTRTSVGLLLNQKLFARSFPFLLRHDWGRLHTDLEG
jgi:hypothetical protein